MVKEQKVERYLQWLEDRDSLIQASKGLIKRKRSPFARMVVAGNQKAIIQAARCRLFSVMDKVQRIDFCRRLCELKNNLKSLSGSDLRREIISWLTSSIIEGRPGIMKNSPKTAYSSELKSEF